MYTVCYQVVKYVYCMLPGSEVCILVCTGYILAVTSKACGDLVCEYPSSYYILHAMAEHLWLLVGRKQFHLPYCDKASRLHVWLLFKASNTAHYMSYSKAQ